MASPAPGPRPRLASWLSALPTVRRSPGRSCRSRRQEQVLLAAVVVAGCSFTMHEAWTRACGATSPVVHRGQFVPASSSSHSFCQPFRSFSLGPGSLGCSPARAVPVARAAVAIATAKATAAKTKAGQPSALSALGLPPLNKRIFLVTGATDGIGLHTAEMLAKQGATVLMHGRDEGKLKHYMGHLSQKYATRTTVYKNGTRITKEGATFDGFIADLGDMREVEGLAESISERYGRLHGLLHNAATIDGDMKGKKILTWDQNEQTMAVNALAPFLLTSKLMPLLQKAGSARVIFTSTEKLTGEDHLDDLQC
ncbi:unnamed protein product, partial [Polarella glacialis]